MNIQLHPAIAFILFFSPLSLNSCPGCVEPEGFPYTLPAPLTGYCFQVETYCQDANGNEYPCPEVIPAECLYGDDVPQLCFKVTNWCGLGDFSAEGIGLEIAGQQIDNLWIELISPSFPGQTFNYCITSHQLSGFFAQGLAFPEGHLPTINFIIDEESFPTTQVLIPSGGVVIGNLVSDGNYQWSESFPVESNLGFKSCLGDPPQSITGSMGITHSENSGFNIGGSINLGGGRQSISGSISGTHSWGDLSSTFYETSISGFLPVVEEEDCEAFENPNCEHCCFHLNAAVEQEIQQYQLVEYSCDGGSQVQEELIPIVADYGAIQFSLGSYITCPNTPLHLTPKKLYGGGNRFVSDPPLGIQIEEFIDFDFYTLTWSGPNGFTAINQTLLENLEPGEYCYTLAHCGCDGPADKGCIVLCPDARPVSDWAYSEEKELYCREFACEQTVGSVEECVDGAPCSPWEYNETGNECFREICHEDELLFVEANAPYHIAYEYNNGFCRTIITCLEGGEEMSIETAAEYSDVFFDENEGACYRYVICGGEIIDTKDAGISDIVWEYSEYEGCIGTVLCNEGSLHDGEVKGGDVETYFEEWYYDEHNGCLRDVNCSFNNDFEEVLNEASFAEERIYWEYADGSGSCTGLVDCNGDIVEALYDLPGLGEWDENAALYNVECVRDAFCGNPFLFGMQFEDHGEIYISFESGPCIDGYKPCYVQIECDGDVVVGNDLAAEIPCEDYCAGNRIPKRVASLLTGIQMTDCGIEVLSNSSNGMVLLKPHAIDGETIERIVTVDMGTGRLISQIELLPDDYQATRLLRLPNRGVYALISYTREGYACYSKIIRY